MNERPAGRSHGIPVAADGAELTDLRARLALMERERETLTAELEARRNEAAADAQERAELRRLLAQAQAMVPRLHDPRAYDDAETRDVSSPAVTTPEPTRRRRWWQR